MKRVKQLVSCTLAALLLCTPTSFFPAQAAGEAGEDTRLTVVQPIASHDFEQAGSWQKPGTEGTVAVENGRLKMEATQSSSAWTTSFVQNDVSSFTMLFDYTPQTVDWNTDTVIFDSWDGGMWDSYTLEINGSNNGGTLKLIKTAANVPSTLAEEEHGGLTAGTTYRVKIVRSLEAGTIQVYFAPKADGFGDTPLLSVSNEKPVKSGDSATHYRGKIWMSKWAGVAYLDNVVIYDTAALTFDSEGHALPVPAGSHDFEQEGSWQKPGTEGTVAVENGRLKMEATQSSSAWTASFVQNDVSSFTMLFDYTPQTVDWNTDTVIFDSWDGGMWDSYTLEINGSNNGGTLKLIKTAANVPSTLAEEEHGGLTAGTTYRVKIVRSLETGIIQVYFAPKADGFGDTPLLSVSNEKPVGDVTHYRGKIWMSKWAGVAYLDNVVVYATTHLDAVAVTPEPGPGPGPEPEPTPDPKPEKPALLVDWNFNDTSAAFPFGLSKPDGTEMPLRYDAGGVLISSDGNNEVHTDGLTGDEDLGDFTLQMEYTPRLTEWNIDSLHMHSNLDTLNTVRLTFIGTGALGLNDPTLNVAGNDHNVQLVQVVGGEVLLLGSAKVPGLTSGKGVSLKVVSEGDTMKVYINDIGKPFDVTPTITGTVTEPSLSSGDIFMTGWAAEYLLDNIKIYNSATVPENPQTGVPVATGAAVLAAASLGALLFVSKKRTR